MTTQGIEQQNPSHQQSFVLPLDAFDRSQCSLAGGKAANLGELVQAGFLVPPGFCVTTAAYLQVSATLAPLLNELDGLRPDEAARRGELAAKIRAVFEQTPIPPQIADAITAAYRALGGQQDGTDVAVAVRSSATAEDLPYASFAGQQESYLNIRGEGELLKAISRCYASLWTERAISYRANLALASHTVQLAVVVQRMVPARVSGVLFTANPLTGKRRQTLIDAGPGLGEAIVSGATTPDHFVVASATGEILERRLGEKRVILLPAPNGGTQRIEQSEPSRNFCLTDEHIRALTLLGENIEAQFGSPQDIEWAMDDADQPFVLQARPITTLFPLPLDAPTTEQELRVYLAFGVQQGTQRPFTPLGISALKVFASGFLAFAGAPLADPLAGPRFITEAALRPYFDVTGALRAERGRLALMRMMEQVEVQAATAFRQIINEPFLTPRPMPRSISRGFLRLWVRTRLPVHFFRALLSPAAAYTHIQRKIEQVREAMLASDTEMSGDSSARLQAAEQLLLTGSRLHLQTVPVNYAGMSTFHLVRRLLGNLASKSESQIVLRGSPYNPTAQMNLALWHLAEHCRNDEATRHLIGQTAPDQLARHYQQGSLPPPLQEGLNRFLSRYGHQGVFELDLGASRWSEDPTYVLGILANYLSRETTAPTPEEQFRCASQQAREMIATLSQRARRRSWLGGWFIAFCLKRAHALAGLREMPRFLFSLLLAHVRKLLWPIGEELTRVRQLAQAEDIFFLSFPEVHEALAGTDFRVVVAERRAAFSQELKRRHVPLVLLSDGTEPFLADQSESLAKGMLRGTPASPGVATAPASVVFDPSTARLAPGEILVAPSTDPSWTPLFLSASAVVMETGGMMSHGAVVAREYGIPAVVGVPQATVHITTGQYLTVDGTTGVVVIKDKTHENINNNI